jgi:hypothetical protein
MENYMLPIALQVTIASTGVAQQLPANPLGIGYTFSAPSSNAQSVVAGNSSAVTSSTGYIISKGTSSPFVQFQGNTNSLWVVGTAADVISLIGT